MEERNLSCGDVVVVILLCDCVRVIEVIVGIIHVVSFSFSNLTFFVLFLCCVVVIKFRILATGSLYCMIGFSI